MKKNEILIINTTLFETDKFSLIAGPCAVEDRDSLVKTAELLSQHGVLMLRGGAHKLRTSPHSFQGLGEEGVLLLSEVAHTYGLLAVCEITSEKELELFAKHIDIVIIGTRNMHNYQLLKEVSHLKQQIILKRGFSATVQEWLLAAEYLQQQGNQQIILCERGIRTFETCTRYTLDLAAAVYVAQNTGYHVLTDPSHATGNRDLVMPMTLASEAAGVSGAMIEIHPEPSKALSDGDQMLDFQQFENLLLYLYAPRRDKPIGSK